MTLSLIPSVRSSVTKEFFLSLKSFNGVSGKFKGCFKEVLWCPVEKEVSGKFQGCFKKVLRVYTESFKSVSRKFQGIFKDVSRKFHSVSRKF